MELRRYLEREAPVFAGELAALAFARGLAVTRPDGSRHPIPVTATPVVIGESELRRRARLSTWLSSAAFKMAEALLRGPQAGELLGALSPLERSLAERTHASLARLATTRVDYFEGQGLFALEVNATIPAMQGYSDIAARAFLEVVGGHFGLSVPEIERLVTQNGENARALHEALLEAYRLERAGQTPARIGLLCRRNDSQLSEQQYLADVFSRLGTEAEVIHPDELSGEDAVYARGKKFDLIYRHLFVRRLEELDAPYVRALFAEVPGRRTVLLNPPCAQVEVKSTFAWMSEALLSPALAEAAALSPEELSAIRDTVPWTRRLRAGPALAADGTEISNLLTHVQADPSRFVLKRAWDYGGKAVFVGAALEHPSYLERVRAAFGAELSWEALVSRAAEDRMGGGFVVQERVDTSPERHLLCSPSGVSVADLYVDFSAYASVGVSDALPWGGVCRGSPSQIVNIVGGGGVLPLLTTEVADALTRAARETFGDARRSADS